ncbi:tetratricopeptide repeat protein [Hydrocarboniphaga sp.]|uniref:tetratricopeptide repeat protein n=1 Tax=Hydrocarboniphaga sp. TaxID=2033016 RepID=UPI003D11F562
MTRSSKQVETAMNRYSFKPLVALTLLALAACTGAPSKPDTGPKLPSTPSTPEAPAAAVPDKGDPEARFKQALELMKAKKTAEAEAGFLKLAQDFPDYTGPQMNLGILYDKSNRREVAISAFSRAAAINPQNASAFNWLGIANREAGNYPRAQQAYEKAIAVKPDYAAAQLNLGILLDEYLKQPAAAVPHYKEYLRLYGKEDLRVLAWIAEIEAAQKAAAPPAATPAATAPAAAGAKK